MKTEPGTYALILRSRLKAKTQIGRWGQIDLAPGYYIYVGSAFGPGGVQARVSRHCRRTKLMHWHIDYLRELLSPLGAWYSHETKRLEHRWARILCDTSSMSSIPKFGCSDCRCYSHLFQTSMAPDFALFSNMAGGKMESWTYRQQNCASSITKKLAPLK
jgi:Uri superfamily endonuclease